MGERKRIGLREVRALEPGQIAWDSAVAGFGARRQKGAAVSYVLKFRTAEGRQRWHVIGRHGAGWTPDQARDEAMRLLGEVVKGADPVGERQAARTAATVGELCDQYHAACMAGHVLVRGGKPKKPATLAGDRRAIEGHIKPILGRMKVAAVERRDIDAFMRKVADGETAGHGPNTRGGRGAATRVVGLLGAIFTHAVERGIRANNPCSRIRKFAEYRRDRRLADAEYAALADALNKAAAAGVWPTAIAATRFLLMSGWRRGEVLALRWSDIDLARRTATLPDTKTGRSMRPLSHAACEVLRGLQRVDDLVFPGARRGGVMGGYRKLWLRIAELGNLPPDVMPHTLRHSFASLAADLGYSEPTIAALVGHKGQTITSRYVHSADAVLLAAADAVARRTAELMGDAPADGDVVPLRVPG